MGVEMSWRDLKEGAMLADQVRLNINSREPLPVRLIRWRWFDEEDPGIVVWDVEELETGKCYYLKERRIGRLLSDMEVIAWASK